MPELFRFEDSRMLGDDFYKVSAPSGRSVDGIVTVEAAKLVKEIAKEKGFSDKITHALLKSLVEMVGNAGDHGCLPPGGVSEVPRFTIAEGDKGFLEIEMVNYAPTLSADFLVAKVAHVVNKCSSEEDAATLFNVAFNRHLFPTRVAEFEVMVSSPSASRTNDSGGCGIYGLARLCAYVFDPLLERTRPSIAVEIREVDEGISRVSVKMQLALSPAG